MAFENRRAILADITDHSLNPKEKHVATKNGRLQVTSTVLIPKETATAAVIASTIKETKKEQQIIPVSAVFESVKDAVEVPQEIVEDSVKVKEVIQEQPEVVKFDAAAENAKLEKKNKGKFKKSLV
jgi:hypothetical protein